ncbi:hypothetical protein [Oceanicella actignis]|uniref:Predicted Na+-dependent transporter n=1 Tax=Oceanicella actignis TaxID=1189325 RepID=A0A1M7SEP2_9RHOB|nr:hypothetical protein [Oceanicella actignis]SET23276.1 bile acid:Na+ symporter, BASS family [Oceanicella actignis]SHN56940.1 Predicted Na+-dependent transporter [Oceanicella actignis]
MSGVRPGAAGRVLIGALAWLGGRARWALALSALVALAVPQLAAALRPFLPALVAMVYALAMTRIDLRAAARLGGGRRAARAFAAAAVMVGLAPLAAFGAARAAGAPPDVVAALVYTLAAPPIASAAGFAFIMGLDAALALEVTLAASILAPLAGAPLAAWLLGAAAPVGGLELALRTGAMIGAGALAAALLRRLLGPARIARSGPAFDGLTVLAMTVFIMPLFDGVGATLAAAPGRAALYLALGSALILGPYLALRRLRRGAAPRAGALALTGGTRSVAIYLAALPPDPLFGLFVALYQIPMVLSPLALSRLARRDRRGGGEGG